MLSQNYRCFIQNLDPARDPRSFTYDTAAFSELSGLERTHVAHQLLEMARSGDVRAIETLAQIPWPDAIPDLEALLTSPRPATRAATHRALARLRGAPNDVARVVDDLSDSNNLSIDAAFELAQRDDPASRAALIKALDADEPVVRMHAMEGLIRSLDLAHLKCDRSPLDAMAARLFNTLDCIRHPAAHAMRSVLQAVIDGATPDDLGLVYVPSPDPAPLQRFLHATDHAPDAIIALGPRMTALGRKRFCSVRSPGETRSLLWRLSRSVWRMRLWRCVKFCGVIRTPRVQTTPLRTPLTQPSTRLSLKRNLWLQGR